MISPVHELFAAQEPGWSLLQLGGLGHSLIEFCGPALRAGAALAVHAEPHAVTDTEWAGLRGRAGVAADDPALRTGAVDITDSRALAWEWPRADVVVAAQLFAQHDPLPVLQTLSGFARRHLVIATNLLPPEDGIEDGAMLPGFLPDARLRAVEAILLRRGVGLVQFNTPPARLDPGGRAYWPGMWEWFMTRGALDAMLADLGWRVVAQQSVWLELGQVLIAERL
ncbi:hypothetical protein EOD42_06590 [Rhodovarius crocodyli]|uniref:Class I SAM-dependent methyltransferase n=1 Tax=Rhodovarius crocodyli TaxID=1979269 RepID=A0A437MIM0_9PROT|nr:hypothetical protein [Rhodovarius crocodyli]RVT97490.1 hypothetical protein EOD42_06590 [Rhodovarius crocodyli]